MFLIQSIRNKNKITTQQQQLIMNYVMYAIILKASQTYK
jgi:hypothetical protein